MNLENWVKTKLPATIQTLQNDIARSNPGEELKGISVTHKREVLDCLDKLLGILFPGVLGDIEVHQKEVVSFLQENLARVIPHLATQIKHFLDYERRVKGTNQDTETKANQAVIDLVSNLPTIRKMLLKDIKAAYEGDPAALSMDEVLVSYPCVDAITTHRIAHQLYSSKIPIVPRIMSERAHSRTGVDIHPGAQIGASFFIDHGTGVVIGETTVIGKNVKIYQGVTLGALSFPKDKDGNPIKGHKRHPNIEDGVILYAGATVLGGQTTIGKGAVIGGNCWVTESVPAGTLVSMESTRTRIKKIKDA